MRYTENDVEAIKALHRMAGWGILKDVMRGMALGALEDMGKDGQTDVLYYKGKANGLHCALRLLEGTEELRVSDYATRGGAGDGVS